MKHFAQIQHEFIKQSRLFENMTIDQQEIYLAEHPNSAKRLDAIGEDIAKKVGLEYCCYWPEMKKFMFNDLITNTTITASNFEEAEFKAEKSHKDYEAAKQRRLMKAANLFITTLHHIKSK
jgi:hypothetical protein